MNQSWRAVAALVALLITGFGDGKLPVPERASRNPEELITKALEQLAQFEASVPLFNGVSKIKPTIQRDTQGRITNAHFAFEKNAVPPAKVPAVAKDASQPFLYISLDIGLETPQQGESQRGFYDERTFLWKGDTYKAQVHVRGSDPIALKAANAALTLPEPPQLKTQNPGARARLVRQSYAKFPADLLNVKEPISVTSAGLIADGGSMGIEFTDAAGKAIHVYLDGKMKRGATHEDYHMYLGDGLQNRKALKLQIRGPEESAIYGLLHRWASAQPQSEEVSQMTVDQATKVNPILYDVHRLLKRLDNRYTYQPPVRHDGNGTSQRAASAAGEER